MSEQDEQEQQAAALADRLAALSGDEPADDEAQAEPPADAGQPAQPDKAAAEPADSPDERPTEGYDPARQAYLKTFSLGTPAALHEMALGDAAGHEAAAGLPEGAARAAQDAGYRPTGDAELVDVRRNGLKSDLTYAVPADPRG